MHACACARSVENNQKHSKISKKVPFSSCTREAHEEKQRKTKKKFVGQRLGVTPKSWLTPKRWLLIWNFLEKRTKKNKIKSEIIFKKVSSLLECCMLL